MEQSEIRIFYNGDRIEVNATLDGNLKPSKLIQGLIAHINTVSEALKKDDREIMFSISLYLAAIKINPDAIEKESVEIRIPKGLNLNGKEGQA